MKRWAAPVLVALAVVATYGNTLANGFVWDDHFVALSPLNRSLSNAGTVLTSADVLSTGQPTNYYRPLSRFLFMVDYQLFGDAPAGWHLVNVAAHLAVALLVLLLGRRLFRADGPALLAALLVAVHPVHSEPVNLVTARNNLLATACVLGSILAYLRARDDGWRRAHVVAAGMFFAGLLFKETAMMLFPLLVLVEATGGRSRREAFTREGPVLGAMAALGVLYLALRAWVLHGMDGPPVTLAHLSQAAVNVLHSVPKYLSIVIWPANLTLGYEEPSRYVTSPWVLASAWVGIAVAVVLLVRQRRPVTRLGLLWMAVNFVPISTVIPFPSAPLAERYLYLPVIGLWLVLADQVSRVSLTDARREVMVAGVTIVVICLGGVTLQRNLDWRDDRTLFLAAVRAEPRSTFAHANLGIALRETGDLDGARRAWEATLALDARHVGALAELGRFHAERGELERAEEYFMRVLSVDGADAEGHFNLALLLERTHRPEGAIAHYLRFLETASRDHPEMVAPVRARVERLRARQPAGSP